MVKIDAKFPEFSLDAYFREKESVEKISTKDLIGKWFILMFYPADFTFVCPTELADIGSVYDEFKKLDTEIIGVSTDTVFTHKAWLDTEKLLSGVSYPLGSDHTGKLSKELGIYDDVNGVAGRATFIIDPDGILRSIDIVSDSIGRSSKETLRRLRALQFVKNNPGKVCPASWDEGEKTIEPSVKKAGKVFEELN